MTLPQPFPIASVYHSILRKQHNHSLNYSRQLQVTLRQFKSWLGVDNSCYKHSISLHQWLPPSNLVGNALLLDEDTGHCGSAFHMHAADTNTSCADRVRASDDCKKLI